MIKAIYSMMEKLQPLTKKLCPNPSIVIFMDGGTSSQISNYVSYRYFCQTHTNVKLDLSYYDKCNKDENSPVARPFNLDKLFDMPSISKTNKIESILYKLFYSYFPSVDEKKNGISVDLSQYKMPDAPVYFREYYYYSSDKTEAGIKEFLSLKKVEDILDDEAGIALYKQITSENNTVVGVHVRRGDMAVVTSNSYWNLIPDDYFVNITQIPEFTGGLFVFFSEEPEYIEKNIIPKCLEKNKNFRYRISKSYSSYYGYKDLFLLSQCDVQVRSQGSFGLYAYYISDNENKKLIDYDKDEEKLWKWHKF